MAQPDLVEQFSEAFEKVLGPSKPGNSATEKWQALRDSMHSTALATFGKRTSKTNDWFEAKWREMSPVIEAKRIAYGEYKRLSSDRNLQALKTARSKVQQAARLCANEYWTELSTTIQKAAETRNTRGMYEGIKKALGPVQIKTAPSNLRVGI